MRDVKVIPTIENGFSCVIHHPKVIVPFIVFFLIAGSILAVVFSETVEMIDYFAEFDEGFGIFGTIFEFMLLVFFIVFFMFFATPFFEGWTFATLASAFKDESVSIAKTARRACSKYFGMLIIAIIIAVISAIVGTFVSIFFSFFIFLAEASHPVSSPASFFYRYALLYGVTFLIMIFVTAVLAYLKPAYMVGENRFSESLKDGFDTAMKNFLPTLAVYLVFTVIQVIVAAAAAAVIFLGGIIDYEQFLYAEGLDVLHSLAGKILPVAMVAGLVYMLFYVALYAALTYAYMDSHEMI